MKYISALERETFIWRIYPDIALNGQFLAYTADFRHNKRKPISLPSCAITDIRCKSLSGIYRRAEHTQNRFQRVFRFQITEETGWTFPFLVVTQLPITKETQSLIGNHDSRNFTAQVYQFWWLELSGLLLESTIQRGALT